MPRRPPTSYLLATALLLGLLLWLVFGDLQRFQSAPPPADGDHAAPTRVEYRLSQAEAYTPRLVAQGQLEPVHELELRTRRSGRVAELPVALGARVAEGERLRLTTLRPAPAADDAQRAARVAWRLVDGELSRMTWPVLDRDLDGRGRERRVLTNVDELGFRFLSYEGGGVLTASSEWTRDGALPAGVEVTVLVDDADYQRILQVGGG